MRAIAVVVSISLLSLVACAGDQPDPVDDGTMTPTPGSGRPPLGHPGVDGGSTTPPPAGHDGGSTTPPPPPPPGTDAGTPSPGKDAGTKPGTDAGSPPPPPPPPPPPSGSSPQIGGCNIYPADNPWNRDVSNDPVDTNAMSTIMPNMHGTTALHADWGDTSNWYGIPFIVAKAPQVEMTWTQSWAASESDQVPCSLGQFCYPIPPNAPVEGGPNAAAGSDMHVIVLDTTGAPDNCTLYELWQGQKDSSDNNWKASNGAVFHLGTNNLRPDGWTSADAAGLPILPGLVRWAEVQAGEIKHALRFTMNNTYNGYIHPATHAAGLSSTSYPPMGMRMRLKASFDTSNITGPALVILTAMKKYGIILADNGSNWYISGETNDGWTAVMDSVVSAMGGVHGSDFEIVQSGSVSTAGL